MAKYVLGEKDVAKLRHVMRKDLSPNGLPTLNGAIPTYLIRVGEDGCFSTTEDAPATGSGKFVFINSDGEYEDGMDTVFFNPTDQGFLEDDIVSVVIEPFSGKLMVSGMGSQIRVAKTTAIIAENGWGSVELMKRSSDGSLEETGIEVSAYNRYLDIGTDLVCHIAYVQTGWEIIAANPCA